MSPSGPALVLLLFAGCAIESAGLRPGPDSRARPSDGGGIDTGMQPSDGGPDTGRPVDGGRLRTDGGGGTGRCAPPDDGTVALWDFESGLPSELIDVAGGHDGTLTAGAGAVASIDGCGSALSFAGSEPPAHGIVPDDAAFDLAVGSLDFWLHLDGDFGDDTAPTRGILSRDAMDSSRPGHMTVFATGGGSVVFRLQSPAGDVLLCSDPIPRRTWTHVGIVFGPPEAELFIDGTRATRTDSTWVPLLGSIQCGIDGAGGIDGNDNPLVVGAASWLSREGAADAISSHIAPAAIDHVRLSSVRRDFSR